MNSPMSRRATHHLFALALVLFPIASTVAHAASLDDVPASGASTHFLRHGYSVQFRHHSDTPGTPNLQVYDSSGKLLYELTIWPSRTSKLFISSVDVGLDNAFAFAGQAVRDDGIKTNFIAIDHLGHTAPRYIATHGYLASQIAMADDGSVWAIGAKPSDDALLKSASSVPNYDVLRHFAPDGTIIDHLMKRWGDGIVYVTHSDVPTFVTGHTSDASAEPAQVESLTHSYGDAWKPGSDIYLRTHGTSAFLYDGRVTSEPGHTQPTLIESDASTKTNSLRYVTPLPTVYVPQIADLSISANGDIYSHQHTIAHANAGKSVGLFKLLWEKDSIQSHWQLVPDPLNAGVQASSAPSVASARLQDKVTPLCTETFPCLAYDYYRSVPLVGVVPTGANHNFWFIENVYGDPYVIDGGPSIATCSPTSACGYIDDWIVYGTVGHYPQDNITVSTLWFNSGYTTANCTKVEDLVYWAAVWPGTTYAYHLLGPNSNTFAADMGNYAGFSVATPPASPGW
jgi:hypothetical protein